MRSFLVFLFVSCFLFAQEIDPFEMFNHSPSQYHGEYYDMLKYVKKEDLKKWLHFRSKFEHNASDYRKARTILFSKIENNDGIVNCIYTNLSIKTNTIPNASVMNTEHVWPQSRGAKTPPGQSDLHHLFPSSSRANSRRSNLFFGQFEKGNKIIWSDESILFKSKQGKTLFMPKENSKGNIARAVFYFSIRYDKRINTDEEEVLRKWDIEDPVDEQEIERNNRVFIYQKNRNPFIDYSELVKKIEDF